MRITDEMAETAWRAYYASDKPAPYNQLKDAIAAIAPLILEEAARVARDACLVPPDGGSPTQAECDVADEAARRIRALASEQDQWLNLIG